MTFAEALWELARMRVAMKHLWQARERRRQGRQPSQHCDDLYRFMCGCEIKVQACVRVWDAARGPLRRMATVLGKLMDDVRSL
ncbi:hypothetical protein M8818_006052 [Zalaria obscura]|uniref:Uncharacterized protein n=1 Tax=Zalaria obscura TaxID=2024903 RepID=A0ACC3S7Q2_9PEZI